MFNYLKIYYDELAALCGPGEQPVAQMGVQYHPGDEEIGPRDSTVTFDLINGLDVPAWNRAVGRMIGGRTLIAPHGGMAIGFRDAIKTHSELMLTDQRLVILEGSLGTDVGEYRSFRLNDIATIHVNPTFLQAGRLLIGFTDGSLVRVMGGLISKKKSRAFAEAFSRVTGR